jgi:hypothetical protein
MKGNIFFFPSRVIEMKDVAVLPLTGSYRMKGNLIYLSLLLE